ncbi:hypothetical protein RAS12_30705 (plasmid) [Achromobacter seleniivolatilans]|uniref:Uncharacterized protein n=1 Tax=Achromobacter seleniivolatilans TaxID=3047478 RepID=A0ABY9MAJ2_9BURK|nr:hypothetical protein [Achromobacter sp. R39]WMD24005.1 hypothetical protein RAS12_30705 [Achromobacter sp. R39]
MSQVSEHGRYTGVPVGDYSSRSLDLTSLMEDLKYTAVDGVWLDGLEFCRQAYRLFERLLEAPDGVTRLRLRPTSFERKLITEILPLAHYLKSNYSLRRYIDVCWHSGNQCYDAEFRQRGESVEQRGLPKDGFFEITTAQHPDDHLARERLEKEGILFSVHNLSTTATKRDPNRRVLSEPFVFTNGSFIEHMADFIRGEIVSKAGKGYPAGFTLVIQCTLNTVYSPEDWATLVGQVQNSLPQSTFGEIWMCDDNFPDERRATLILPP